MSAICSRTICSSNNERRTMAADPASSSCLTVSISSLSGEAPAIIGCGRLMPRYVVLRSMGFLLFLRLRRLDIFVLCLGLGNGDPRQLLVDRVAFLRVLGRLLEKLLEPRRIGALDHAEARLVAHVVGHTRPRRTVVQMHRRLARGHSPGVE